MVIAGKILLVILYFVLSWAFWYIFYGVECFLNGGHWAATPARCRSSWPGKSTPGSGPVGGRRSSSNVTATRSWHEPCRDGPTS